jgi:RNA polymerase sigma factor (sigma-70 family)
MRNRAEIRTTEPLTQQADSELLGACLKGDSAAWETLIVRYQRLIYSIPIKMGLSANDAADVFQSVCVKLLESLSTLRNLERVSAWLTTTTKRECWRVAARRRRDRIAMPFIGGDGQDQAIEIASSTPLADEQHQFLEQQQILREAVDALPERCRNLITLLFYQDGNFSYAETARRMNIPLNSMGATRARCLAKLKKLLEGKL